jgi:thiamine biosynthesis protein ThiS
MIKVSDHSVKWHEGMTITDLLNEINDPYPYVVVRINEKYVSRPNFDKTIIPDNAEVFLIPMIVGG